MSLLKNCSFRNESPWLHYTVNNYFTVDDLNELINHIPNLIFLKSQDNFRDEYYINSGIIFDKIINNFLNKQNLDYLYNQDKRIKDRKKYLRVSIWKDYNGFTLPIHTDSLHKLFTMQIYLPLDNKGDYGTSFYDENGNYVYTTEYIKNCGYYFFPNIHGIKTNHTFNKHIKTERCSIVFNIFDKDLYNKKYNTINSSYIEF